MGFLIWNIHIRAFGEDPYSLSHVGNCEVCKWIIFYQSITFLRQTNTFIHLLVILFKALLNWWWFSFGFCSLWMEEWYSSRNLIGWLEKGDESWRFVVYIYQKATSTIKRILICVEAKFNVGKTQLSTNQCCLITQNS